MLARLQQAISLAWLAAVAAVVVHGATHGFGGWHAVALAVLTLGHAVVLAVEFGRKVLYPAHRPSFSELEQAMRGS